MKEENNEIVSAAETISVDYEEILQRAVALLPWSHNILILSRELNDSATLCYAQEGVAKGWNRDLLLNALKLLCAEKENVEVALSLEDMGKPIGVADYQLIIPKEELQKTISAEIHSFELEQAVKEQQKKKEDEA